MRGTPSASLLLFLFAIASPAKGSPPDARVLFSSRPLSLPQALHPDASSTASAVAPPASARTIPHFEDAFAFGGQTYPYVMVGQNPKTSQRTTKVGVVIVPLRFVFADGGVFDPSSTVARLRRSPLFRPAEFASGVTQYGDAIQRAEFWTYTQSTGYHALLRRPRVTAPVVVRVPADQGFVATSNFGGTVGVILETSLSGQIVPAVINQLQLSPRQLTILWSYDIDLQTDFGASGAILGEHSATSNGAGTRIWTWAWASWHSADTVPDGSADIAALSHEIAEWYNNPFGANEVPPWESPPSYPCNPALEVGDAVTGITFPVNGYHLQDELFLSWFTRDVPSIGLGGMYTYLGTFTAPAAVCTPAGSM